MSFKLISDLKSQLEALEKASHGKIEVWADLPAHENDLQNQLSGKPVPLRFGPADSDSQGTRSHGGDSARTQAIGRPEVTGGVPCYSPEVDPQGWVRTKHLSKSMAKP